jgi:hypothetical protein
MNEKELIKTIKPKLKRMAGKHMPTAPSISNVKVHDLNGDIYSRITFLAKSKYKRIDGKTITETYHCSFDGDLNVE